MSDYVTGLPGVRSDRTATARRITFGGMQPLLARGKIIDGSESRDPGNTGNLDVLRAGLLMGKRTANSLFAPSVIGTLGDAYDGAGTQMNFLTAAMTAELTRRVGATGTFKITGPPTAGGTVQTSTVTYSSVGAGTGGDEVQTFTPNAVASAGTYRVKLSKPDGTFVYTANIAFGATLAACQAAITLALGSAGWVASSAGSAAPWSTGPIALVLTASGTGYLKTDLAMCSIDIASLTGVASMTEVQTTRGIPTAGTVTVTALGAAVNAVQTITPTVGGNVAAIQTITPSAGGNVNEIQTVTIGGTHSGGTLRIGFRTLGDPDSQIYARTATCAWSGTEATMTATIQAAMDALLGANVCVLTQIPDTDAIVMTLTFSGTGATNRPHGPVEVDIDSLTGATNVTTVRTAVGSGTISAGTYRLGVTDPSGNVQWTNPIAYNANAGAINTALDDALGVAGVVATGGPISTPAAVVLTYSGTGYTNMPQLPVQVDFNDVAGLDDVSVVETTPGSGGIRADGTYMIGAVDASGNMDWTGPIAANGNDAAINTALDAAFGASTIVATGGPFSTPTPIVLTFSGTGFAGVAQDLVSIDTSNILGSEDLDIVSTATGVTAAANDFIAGSLIQPTDGSETILSLINDGYGIKVTDQDSNDIDVDYSELVIGGQIVFANIVNAPTDTSLITYVKAALNAAGEGYAFEDTF